jgi:hypothetical protein
VRGGGGGADHSAQEHIQIGAATNGQGPNQLCNGVAHKGRTCYNFTVTNTIHSCYLSLKLRRGGATGEIMAVILPRQTLNFID